MSESICKHCQRSFISEHPKRYCSPICCGAAEQARAAARLARKVYDKADLLKRLRKILRESEQLVIDIQSWNDNRSDAAPFDCGADLVRANLAREAILLIEQDKDATVIVERMAAEKVA